MPKSEANVLEMANEVIVAFLSKNATEPGIVTDLMRSVHATLVELEKSETRRAALAALPPQKPAVSIEQSAGHDFVVCLDCGKRFKTLSFHLRTHGLSPAGYRAQWALPANHPLVAPELAAKRSAVARKMKFGTAWRKNRETTK